MRCFCDGLGIIVVVLLALVERLHIDRRNNPRFEAHAAQRPADEMGAEARLHSDNATREMIERRGQGQPLDLLAQDQLTGSVKPNQMESLFADVDPDHGEFLNASFLLRMHRCFSY